METDEGILDVTKLTLRELNAVDKQQREHATRHAFEHTIRNGVAMVSQSGHPEFSDLSLGNNGM